MIRTPRAFTRSSRRDRRVRRLLRTGTNDLTQMTFGFGATTSSRMMPAYLETGLLKRNPFETIDQSGVGWFAWVSSEAAR
ncbi:MAG: hypothetical protein R2705_24655 [Ilumatobacteraceae bacterium]